MLHNQQGLMAAVRERFAHVDACPFSGARIFLETAGGALTLKSVVETTARLAAVPDNQGRDNPASAALVAMIAQGKADMRLFLNATTGTVFVGESGTEILFRLIRTACMATPPGRVLGSTLEHPASRSACGHWAAAAGKDYLCLPHDDAAGCVTAADYAAHITPDTRVATIVHTSPVTGMRVDVGAIAATIRATAPDCLIIVDGIQHAAHGGLDIDSYGIDGYAISPYKVFSRHGYGVGWASDRLTALPHERLAGSAADSWELGTRDTSAYATFSDVVRHFEWLGQSVGAMGDARAAIVAASEAIRTHEDGLVAAMLHGTGGRPGLAAMPRAVVIGGVDNPAREGLVSFAVKGMAAEAVVAGLNARGIRAHTRKADHYSGNILVPLGLDSCVRVSFGHYNTLSEIEALLEALPSVIATA